MGKPIQNFPSLPVIDTRNIGRDIEDVDKKEEEKIYTEMYDYMNDKQKQIMAEIIRVRVCFVPRKINDAVL
jgi:hypothetical protein